MSILPKLLWLGVAGAAGTLLRFGIIAVTPKESILATGVLWANIIGCASAGIIWGLSQELVPMSEDVKLILLVGFLGALTTFSAIVMEASALFQQGQWLWGIGYLVLQNVTGLVAFFGLSVLTQRLSEALFM